MIKASVFFDYEDDLLNIREAGWRTALAKTERRLFCPQKTHEYCS
jgi:hypothetical protein